MRMLTRCLDCLDPHHLAKKCKFRAIRLELHLHLDLLAVPKTPIDDQGAATTADIAHRRLLEVTVANAIRGKAPRAGDNSVQANTLSLLAPAPGRGPNQIHFLGHLERGLGLADRDDL